MRNRISSPGIQTLHHWITICHLSLLWSKINSLFKGTQRPTITSFYPISRDHYEIPKSKDHLDAKLELSFSRYPQQKHPYRRISEAPSTAQTYPTRV